MLYTVELLLEMYYLQMPGTCFLIILKPYKKNCR